MNIEDIFKNYGSSDIIFDPIPSYDGDWLFGLINLHKNALISQDKKNLFDEFFKEIYVQPIKQMFGTSASNILKFNMCFLSTPKKDRSQGRCLKLSKSMFYKGLLSYFNQNIDLLNKSVEEQKNHLIDLYNNITISDDAVKLAYTNEVKDKLAKIKDLKNNEINSIYYDEALKDYEIQKSIQGEDLSFREFLNNLDTIFSDLLKGLFVLSDFFDKEIDFHKLADCFDKDVFYLLFAKIIYETNLVNEDKYGGLSNNYGYLMYYKEALHMISKDNKKYNPVLKDFVLANKRKVHNYNRFEYLKELESLIARHSEIKLIKLPEVVNDPDKYKDIDLMSKLQMLYSNEIQVNWTFLPKGEGIIKNINEKVTEDNGIEILDVDEDLTKETNMRIDIMMNSNFIGTPIEGKNSFLGYYAFVYQNGVVILEKFWQTKDLKPAKENATYVMNIDNFIEMSKLSKTSLIEYMRLMDNSGMKRIFHDNLNSWQQAVFQEINAETKYSIEDAIKFINGLINKWQSEAEEENERNL